MKKPPKYRLSELDQLIAQLRATEGYGQDKVKRLNHLLYLRKVALQEAKRYNTIRESPFNLIITDRRLSTKMSTLEKPGFLTRAQAVEHIEHMQTMLHLRAQGDSISDDHQVQMVLGEDDKIVLRHSKSRFEKVNRVGPVFDSESAALAALKLYADSEEDKTTHSRISAAFRAMHK